MIENKKTLNFFLEADRIARGEQRTKPRFWGDEIWKFQRSMRMLDYYSSTSKTILYYYWKFRYHKLGLKLGFSIPFDVIGPGLSIVHYGSIVISSEACIGRNFRIHSGVNIGATGGGNKAAIIGDNVYIGPGAKIVGEIKIGNNVVIGANAVVVKDVENSITVGGVPAKKISEKDSSEHIIKATELCIKH